MFKRSNVFKYQLNINLFGIIFQRAIKQIEKFINTRNLRRSYYRAFVTIAKI